jgi:hypothetical protein
MQSAPAPTRLGGADLAAPPRPEVDLPGFLLGVAAHGDVVAYPFGAGGAERVLVADPAVVHDQLAKAGPDGDATRDTEIFATARRRWATAWSRPGASTGGRVAC